MKLEIITLIIRLVIAVMAGICIPAFKHWLDTKTENEKLMQIRQTAETAVYAAEQLMRKKDPTGEDRRKYAHQLIAITAMRLGVELTDNEIDSMIQAAVQELNFFTHKEIADADMDS
jgi:Tfp pilus assembly protein FimT